MSTAPSVAAGLSLAAATAARAPPRLSPSTGSMCSLDDGVGVLSATVSISTPPSAESISRCFLAARSSVKLA